MARFYGIKIMNETMVLEEVPKLWRQKTWEWLNRQTVE